MNFIKNWDEYISIEENNSRKSVKNLWTIPLEIREKSSSCISNLIISRTSKIDGRFCNQYVLIKSPMFSQITAKENLGSQKLIESFLDTAFTDGDPVIVTVGDSFHPVAIGFLKHITKNSMTIYTDKPITKRNFNFNLDNANEREHFTIDKDEYSSGASILRGNILNLFNQQFERRLCELIVELKPPRFNPNDLNCVDFIKEEVNKDQLNAILNVVSCKC
jgi:hypothetical protein